MFKFYELIKIIESKNRIYKDLGTFLSFIQNSIKLDNKLGLKIRKINIFRNKTPRRMYIIKIHSIWNNIRGHIKEQSKERKFNCEAREID